MKRRDFIAGLAAGFAALFLPRAGRAETAMAEYPFSLSTAEWEKRLDKMQFHVLRKAGTERAFSSELCHEKRNGTYLCAGCDVALFSSKNKFESGTGWPSFWQPVGESAVGTSTDHKLGYPRTEVHCANCGGHLGHVFPDGPEPTGLRYCINGVALKFVPSGV